MTNKIYAKWKVSDGHVNNGTHQTVIDPYEFDDDMTEDNIADTIQDIVHEDFMERVQAEVSNLQEAVYAIMDAMEASGTGK